MSRGRAASLSIVKSRPARTGHEHPTPQLRITRTDWRATEACGVVIHQGSELPPEISAAAGEIMEAWPAAWRGCVSSVWLVDEPVDAHASGIFDHETRAMTILGRRSGPKSWTFPLSPIVLDHELAHACEDHLPGGPSAFAARWRAAQSEDAFRGLAYESHSEPGVEVLVGDLWVSGPAKATKRVSEDWAEAFALYLREQRGTPIVSGKPDRRFADLYPARARLLVEMLASEPWIPPSS